MGGCLLVVLFREVRTVWIWQHCESVYFILGWKKIYDQPRQQIKKQRHYFANKGPSSQGYGFLSSHVWMWELGYKEGWVLKNWCFWTVVLEETLESHLDCKEIKLVHFRGHFRVHLESCIFIGRDDVETETPILWSPDVKNWLIWKDPDAGKDWRREEKGMPEDEMVGWHHRLNGHEFEWTPGAGDGQGGLACCSPWGHSLTRLNWTELIATSMEASLMPNRKRVFFLWFCFCKLFNGVLFSLTISQVFASNNY